MACAPLESPPLSLADAVDRAHCWAEDALAQPGRAALPGIWWMSTHLAAADHAVYPVMHRLLPDARPEIAAQRRRGAELTRLLWTLEHRLTGDARLGEATLQAVTDLAERVRAHARVDAALVERLRTALAPESVDAVHRRYAEAVGHAPSRPHPVAARSRLVAAASFRVLAAVDAVRDTMDSRHIPRQVRG